MNQKEFAKSGLTETITLKEAVLQGWKKIDTSCTDNAAKREAALLRVKAKYPIHEVMIAVDLREETKSDYGTVFPFHAYPCFMIRRNEHRIMGVVEKAIEGLRKSSVKVALDGAMVQYHKMAEELRGADWDLNKLVPYVPYPKNYKDTAAKALYKEVSSKRASFRMLFANQNKYQEEGNVPTPMNVDADLLAHHLDMVEYMANFEFDAYLFKMVKKLGTAEKAELTENYGLFSYSFLKVTRADGSVENWKTQQIVNFSVYGLPYNQWPTRLIK